MSTLSLSPPPPPPSTLQSPTEDQAAALRAAALRTLKAKRRKGTESTDIPMIPPPRPPTSQSSIQLDYGSEESPATATPTLAPTASPALAPTTVVSVPTPPPASIAEVSTPTPVLDHVPMDVDDDQTREEGEISDSESAPPSAPASKSSPVLSQVPPSNQPSKPSPTRVDSSPKLPPPPRPSVSIKVEPTLIVEPSPSSSVPSGPSPELPSSVDSDMYYVDDEHIRPGLRMTQSQYDTAKDVILDLLGWGVPPDYLLQIGLSREIVYYVFVELNLQLPAGLDVSGLPPVSSWVGHTYSSPEPMSPATQRAFKARSAQATRRSTTSSGPHPSLPRKPDAPQGTHPNGTPISVSEPRPVGMPEPSPSGALDTNQSRQPGFPPRSSTASESSPARVDPSPIQQPLSLHDMEQQRRQELLARKAVLASRKKQQTTMPSPVVQPAIPPPRKVSNPPPTPKQTVDDFLNSIGPVSGEVKPDISSGLGDEMDVDDQIPGLSASNTIFPPNPPPREMPPPSEASTSPSESISPSSIAFPPPSEATSSQSTRSSSTEIDQNILASIGRSGSSDSSDRSTPRLPPHGSRRTAKRPVAADFVDMELDPTRAYHGHHHPYPRRKPFAGLTGSRRMIIDLSDSEDDTEDYRAEPVKRVSRHLSQPVTPSGVATPEALLEKEQEIKMLREKIAQRERKLQGRMAAVSTKVTPTGAGATQPLQPSAIVKEEEDDSKASASLHVTPPISEPNGVAFAPFPSSESSSGRGTPIDVASKVLEHPVTGDQVLTSEAWQEQVARMPSPVCAA